MTRSQGNSPARNKDLRAGWWAALFMAIGAALAFVQTRAAESWPAVSKDTVEKYLFTPHTDTYAIGDRVYKWSSDIVIFLGYEKGRDIVESIVSEVKERGAVGEVSIRLLDRTRNADGTFAEFSEADEKFNIMIGTGGGAFELFVPPGPPRGLEEYFQRATEAGCYAEPKVPYADREYRVIGARIFARDDLNTDRFQDCMTRGFLLSMGLMYTPDLAFRDEPLSAAEWEEALSVLRVLYHPAVRPGMTREEFYRATTEIGLVAE